jgi:hypothetical protein
MHRRKASLHFVSSGGWKGGTQVEVEGGDALTRFVLRHDQQGAFKPPPLLPLRFFLVVGEKLCQIFLIQLFLSLVIALLLVIWNWFQFTSTEDLENNARLTKNSEDALFSSPI